MTARDDDFGPLDLDDLPGWSVMAVHAQAGADELRHTDAPATFMMQVTHEGVLFTPGYKDCLCTWARARGLSSTRKGGVLHWRGRIDGVPFRAECAVIA